MADELRCGHCRHVLSATESVSASICPKCGAQLSAIVRGVPSAVSPVGVEPTPPSGELSDTGEPSGPADDALLAGEPKSSEDGDDFDSSMRSTVFDFPVPPKAVFPELSSTVLSATSSPIPASVSPSPITPGAGSTVGAAASFSKVGSAAKADSWMSHPSPLMFKLAVSYGSAVTLICLYLGYLLSQRSPTLDLPDLAPPAKSENRVTTLLYVPPETEMHPAQKLNLGQSRQYGALRVTPLRVSRGPLEFVFFDPAAGELRPASKPVLKLYLRFENVSDSQEVVPLDRHLVFTKEPDRKNFGRFKANNFVCAADERSQYDRHVLVYDLSPESEWLIREENLDRTLKPGESVVSFIPTTEEGWTGLSGPLVWRVHLRKGYNPTSLRGVTTLIEVTFNRSEIVDEDLAHCGTG